MARPSGELIARELPPGWTPSPSQRVSVEERKRNCVRDKGGSLHATPVTSRGTCMAREIEACGAVEPPQFFVFNFGKRHWMPNSLNFTRLFWGMCWLVEICTSRGSRLCALRFGLRDRRT
jgi:hypothetical protein